MQCTNIKILANNYSHVMANNQKIANMKYYFYIMSKYILKKINHLKCKIGIGTLVYSMKKNNAHFEI